ncbi:hypothetical protein Mesau_05729 [Mesorhizobium australicum WSM2073]|uniref:Uncharacterized protein n=3 Tax=Mesorhizobium TaxID=68287 RepID=L0KVL2_MESAW|nr:hypothetical protein Mesci_5678 [Mesorhizobium ciceri biovar biserrulae WSM1271]AEH90642.1 hypothetical protein Mesop_6258 [Mesorhizobium opportunistum WSM2075]AGB48014.1 hypothetical protein Mesau_05729 [Mesorhizobium australicum WSM2073]OBP89894.1 hypothetical protein BAE40_13335 [Mesorhizobium loti]
MWEAWGYRQAQAADDYRRIELQRLRWDRSNLWSSEVRGLEERVRDLERLLGRKTMQVEILKDALAGSDSK